MTDIDQYKEYLTSTLTLSKKSIREFSQKWAGKCQSKKDTTAKLAYALFGQT
jgi:hypothetical protein